MWGNQKVVSLGPVSEWLKRGEKPKLRDQKLDEWEARIENAKGLNFWVQYGVVLTVLAEMEEFSFRHMSPEAVPAFAGPNEANPNKGAFEGDGHILLNMVIYAGAGFVISLILKYMGRGELAMIAICITGFVILRQFVFILKELMRDVLTITNM